MYHKTQVKKGQSFGKICFSLFPNHNGGVRCSQIVTLLNYICISEPVKVLYLSHMTVLLLIMTRIWMHLMTLAMGPRGKHAPN